MANQIALSALCLTMVGLGCSSTSDQNGGTPAGDSSTDGTSETAPPGDSGDTGGDTTPTPVKGGSIALAQNATVVGATTVYSTIATVDFYSDTSSGSTSKCTRSKAGGCDVLDCDLTPAGDAGVDAGGDSGVVKHPTAGDVTITGGKLASAGIVLSANATTGLYKSVTGSAKLYDGGDVLTVKAAGGDVAAFDGKTVAAPGDTTLSSPACASFACPDLDRTADLNVTWTGGSAGTFFAVIGTTQTGKHGVTVTCSFNGPDGKGTVGKDALAKLDKADGTTITGFMVFSPSNSSVFNVGDYAITFTASATGTSGKFNVAK